MEAARLFEATPDGERGYVDQRWEAFAACAWHGYTRFGRGVVLVTVLPPDAPDKAGLIEYVSDASATQVWPGRGWPEPTTARAVAEYDPQKCFLVMFLDYAARTCRLHRFESEEPLPQPPPLTSHPHDGHC